MLDRLLDSLYRWNRWGRAHLKAGYKRTILQSIEPFINTPEIVVLTGLRRSGKTTIIYQIMDYLESQSIPKEAMLHMNFEEPSIGPMLNLDLLDEIYQLYRQEIYPVGKAYIFFDEIQGVPGWERWVRARNESEDIKIFITGSSANLMSRELATLLTGRHVNFHITPLSFTEFLQFREIKLETKKRLPISPDPIIQNALNQYLKWGGFPEIVLSDSETRKQVLLKQYFDDILFKDVAMRHQVRDIVLLRNIAVHQLTQTANLISINRIAKLFQISLEAASDYCGYLQEAFLIDFLSFYSLKVAERNRNPRKVYSADLGLRQVVSLAHSEDKGKLIETAVYHHLQRCAYGNIFYWKDKQEVDFMLRKGNTIYSAVQVVYENLDDAEVFQREQSALDAMSRKFKKAKGNLVTAIIPKKKVENCLPLWLFLLDDQLKTVEFEECT